MIRAVALASGAALLAIGAATLSFSGAARDAEPRSAGEPGVLMLHSVALADSPTSIRLLEVYANRDAYEAHIKSPHFVKYKTSTETMVKSLKLIETSPILLCAKASGSLRDSISC